MSIDRNIIELQLWDSLRIGDQSALQKLYLAYYKDLLQYGLKFTTDREALKDSINSTFLYLWEKHENLSEANHVGNYIFKSYQRQLAKDLKTQPSFESLSLAQSSISSDIEEFQFIVTQEEKRRVAILKSAILKLPKRQRELISLRYYENLSYDEIVLKTGLTKRAVYNQIHIAINSLKKDTNLKDLKQTLLLLSFF